MKKSLWILLILSVLITPIYADTLSDLLKQYGTPEKPVLSSPSLEPKPQESNSPEELPQELLPDSNYEDLYSHKDKQSIQFTCEKSEIYAAYIDTGIKTDTLESEDVLSIVVQIANATENKYIKGDNEVLILVKGTLAKVPIKRLQVEELNGCFKGSEVEVVFKQSKQNNQFALSDYLETYKDFKFIINDKEITLQQKPFVENNRVLFPIREVTQGIGAEVKWDRETGIVTIKKDNMEFTLKENSTKLIIKNGAETKTLEEGAIPRIINVNGEERLFAYIEDIVVALGREIYWDAAQLAVVLK